MLGQEVERLNGIIKNKNEEISAVDSKMRNIQQ